MKKFTKQIGKAVAGVALLVTRINANSTCLWYAHQPKLPKGAKKLRKF